MEREPLLRIVTTLTRMVRRREESGTGGLGLGLGLGHDGEREISGPRVASWIRFQPPPPPLSLSGRFQFRTACSR